LQRNTRYYFERFGSTGNSERQRGLAQPDRTDEGAEPDWDELIAAASDGDISQYHYIKEKVNLKQIAVFIDYRIKKAKAMAESYKQ